MPAERARLPVFADVLADIGDEQSIAASLSTFSGHLRNLVHVLEAATPRTLVLLDEVAAGTDPIEGAALARALLDELSQRAALTITTTHYAEVKQWASATPGALNGAVGLRPRDARAHLHAHARAAGAVARARDRAPARARRGRDRARPRGARAGAGRDRAAAARGRALRAGRGAPARRGRGRARRGRGAARAGRAARGRRSARRPRPRRPPIAEERERARSEAQSDLAAHRSELEALREELRAARREERRRRAAPSAEAREAEAERDRRLGAADARARVAGRAIDEALDAPVRQTRALEVGDPVRARALGLRGVITEIVDGIALVQGGAMRVHVAARAARARSRTAARRSTAEPAVRVRAAAMSHAPSLLDLRGQRADEAREAVRQLVDDAYLAGLPEVEIVHGRGTGAVRSAVREELDRHPLVERHASESADGATRVTLASRSAD